MSNDSWFGIEPPKDAEGKVIPLDTEVLYDRSGKALSVDVFSYAVKRKRWVAVGTYEQPLEYKSGDTEWFSLAPPDSWEKLIDDLRNAAERDIATCAYLSPEGKGCTKCQAKATRECTRTAFTDILSRIERLSGANND